MSCTTFCFVCFYQPAFCRVCVFILWTSCLLTNKWNEMKLLRCKTRKTCFLLHFSKIDLFIEKLRLWLTSMNMLVSSSNKTKFLPALQRISCMLTPVAYVWISDKLATCSPGWFLFENKCYRIFRFLAFSNDRAKRICGFLHGKLVVPK